MSIKKNDSKDTIKIVKNSLSVFSSKHFIKLKRCLKVSISLITNERSERSFYQQSYIVRLDDIQTAFKPLKKIGKSLNNFSWSFKDEINHLKQ